jgi:hypothetical protein
MSMRIHVWPAVATLALLAACSEPAPEHVAAHAAAVDLAPKCDANDPAKHCSPRFNEVFLKNTHNSYWVNRTTTDDAYGAGPQQRIWDQLLHEHVRSIELDLHKDIDDPYFNRGYHPGELRVYHTSLPDNSTCFSLADCLQLLQRLDNVLPNHEVIHIALEFKQIDRWAFDDSLFDGAAIPSDFHPEDLDRILWEHLGSRLYTPGEFMSQCDADPDAPSVQTLRDCAGKDYAQWPTLDELRGRYIVTVHGTETSSYPGATNERAWWKYAGQDDNQPLVDIRHRAAFPMFVVSRDTPDTEIPAERARHYNHEGDAGFMAKWRRALDNTIFWDLEAVDGQGGTPARDFWEDAPGGPINRRYHGIVRPAATHLVRGPMPACDDCGDTLARFPQEVAVQKGWNILMTDYPANFISDFLSPFAPQLPSRVDRPFFEAFDVGLSDKRSFAPDDLREPGQRFYFDTAPRLLAADGKPAFDIFNLDGTHLEADARKTGVGRLMHRNPPRVADWELAPSTSMETHTRALNPGGGQPPLELTPFGDGCFVAEAASGDYLKACRGVRTDNARSVYVRVIAHTAAGTYDRTRELHRHLIQGESLGDLLRVRVDRSAAGTLVSVSTAAQANPDGSLFYTPFDHDFRFDSDLSRQGLEQHGDGVFTGTRLNGAPVAYADFDVGPTGYVHDVSYCGADGRACERRSYDQRETVWLEGAAYTRIHQAHGKVFGGQERTIYTTDRFEARASGLPQVWESKFLLRTNAPDSSWAPVYRCVDWRRDMHVHWLSLSPACNNSGDDPGQPYGVLGYLSRTQRPGTQPLYHLRDGTQNATGAGTSTPEHDTHDHYFAVGEADHYAWTHREHEDDYDDYELLGYVPVLPASAVTIDARGLTKIGLQVDGAGEVFDSDVLRVVELPAGPHYIYVPNLGANLGEFRVGDDGSIDFDASRDLVYGGRGSHTLVVKAYPVTIDATALSASTFNINWNVIGGTHFVNEVRRFNVLPGSYLLCAPASQDCVGFSVGPAGVDYDPALEGIVTGHGSRVLKLVGAELTVDATAVDVNTFNINWNAVGGTHFDNVRKSFRVLPGGYTLCAPASQDCVNFTVTTAGTVDYAEELSAFLHGRGGHELKLSGAEITVDATALDANTFNINWNAVGGTHFDNVRKSFRMLPGGYTLCAPASQDCVTFTVSTAGTIQYDQGLGDWLHGAGGRELRVTGAEITFDATALDATTFNINWNSVGGTHFDNVEKSFAMLPGGYTFCAPASAHCFAFSLTVAGVLDYAAELDSLLEGKGGRRLLVKGIP